MEIFLMSECQAGVRHLRQTSSMEASTLVRRSKGNWSPAFPSNQGQTHAGLAYIVQDEFNEFVRKVLNAVRVV
jgi:hypothetical protein